MRFSTKYMYYLYLVVLRYIVLTKVVHVKSRILVILKAKFQLAIYSESSLKALWRRRMCTANSRVLAPTFTPL